jgi:8-oxo-dGTP diphosphatase
MLYRNKKDNDISVWKWNGIGGKIESWESPDQGMIREIKEETWFEVLNMSFKGVITAPNFDNSWDDFVIFVYRIDQWQWTMIECDEWELHWIGNDDITSLNLREGDKVFLPLVYQPWFFTILQHYTDTLYIDWKLTQYTD